MPPRPRARGQPPQHRVGALAVEAEPVDHALVARQAEQARARIAGLRQRRHRADLDEAEAEPQQRIGHLGVLVEARRHADRIGKIEPEGAHGQARIVRGRRRERRKPQGLDRERMGVLGFDQAHQRPRERVEQADHAGELRKHVAAVGAERQRLDPQHGVERQRAIEMRKQRTAARGLPPQGRAERPGVDRDQHQVGGAGEMLGGGLGDLRRGGEMDEAVARIDRGAAKAPLALGLAPQRGGADFIDRGPHGSLFGRNGRRPAVLSCPNMAKPFPPA